jgi:hypothetical protein
MKRLTIILSLLIVMAAPAFAQNSLQAADDKARIVLTPIVTSNASFPSYAQSAVKNKLLQVVTTYGAGGTTYDPRFVITANFVELFREATPTTPPMVAIHLSPTLYIGDAATGTLFASCSLPEVKGVGNNETKAYMAAVKALKVKDDAVATLIEQGKNKIIEYYNSQIDFLIANADALVSKEDYNGAIAMLMTVPDVCKEAYEKAMAKVEEVYMKKVNVESAQLLNSAKQAWSADMSEAGAQTASEYLSQIHPNSSSYAEGQKLADTIAKRIKELDQREWDFKMKQHEDNVKLQSQTIEAARQIGVAEAKRPITYTTNVYWW